MNKTQPESNRSPRPQPVGGNSHAAPSNDEGSHLVLGTNPGSEAGEITSNPKGRPLGPKPGVDTK